MIFEQIKVGGYRNFSYLIGDEKRRAAAAVDPSFSPQRILEIAQNHGLRIIYIINTHSHGDHVNGNHYLKTKTGAKILGYEGGGSDLDVGVKDGEVIELGTLKLNIIHTPGHTDDGICILVEDRLLTGDTLFVGKVGGTDYGSGAKEQYESFHRKLLVLDDSVKIYPGHDCGVTPFSTMEEEKRSNPFLLQSSFEDFVSLKKNWLQYKAAHGIR